MNHGVIEGKRDTDFVAGTLPYEVRNESGDWTQWLPPGEWQRGSVDTMACVTFSALNSIETQYKFLTGESRNFSDRFTAKMSGTTPDGNWLYKVADSIRKHGIVDEFQWPMPATFTWESYYSEIPDWVQRMGPGFLEKFEVKYEWVDFSKESLMHHLKHAPIQVVIPGHAVLAFYRNEDIAKYFDSYAPFIKERREPFSSALKIVLSIRQDVMDEQTVKNLYLLGFNRLPDAGELAFWKGRSSAEFAKVAVSDRAKFLTAQSNG